MKVLPKVIFTASFFLIGILCILFLYGYRFNIEEQRIQRKGVLFISGKDELMLTLDGEQRKITLPYTNTNLSLGSHIISLAKDGYLPLTQEVEVDDWQATLLSGHLAPNWTLTPRTTYTKTDDIQYFVTPTGQLVEFFSQQGKVFLYTAPANIRQKTPNTFITLPPSTTRGTLTSIQPIGAMLFLATFEGEDLILEFATQQAISIPHSEAEQLFVEHNHIFSWNPTGGILSLYNEATGEKTSQSWANLRTKKDIREQHVPTSLFYSADTDSYMHIQESLLGQIDLVSTTIPSETKEIVSLRRTAYNLSSTGLLMSGTSEIAENIDYIASLHGISYATMNNGNIYTISSMGLEFLTRFSSQVQTLFHSYNQDYIYAAESQRLLYCERIELAYCTTVLERSVPSVFLLNEEQTVLFASDTEGNTIEAYFSAIADE